MTWKSQVHLQVSDKNEVPLSIPTYNVQRCALQTTLPDWWFSFLLRPPKLPPDKSLILLYRSCQWFWLQEQNLPKQLWESILPAQSSLFLEQENKKQTWKPYTAVAFTVCDLI